MNNPLQAMIVAAIDKKPDEFTQAFEAAIQEKLQDHVNDFKAYIQATLLGDEIPEETETEEENVNQEEGIDLVEVFEMFLEQNNEDAFESLEDAVIAFAQEVELSEDEAVEFFDFLNENQNEIEEENLDELHKSTLGSYVRKSTGIEGSKGKNVSALSRDVQNTEGKAKHKNMLKLHGRMAGVKKATHKLEK